MQHNIPFKRSIFTALLCAALTIPGAAMAKSRVDGQCSVNGIPLYGKVKVVRSGADLKVKVVESFPDLKVKQVAHFPDKCGKWQFVESFPDFTVQFVDSFPDMTIKFVESFPGRP